MDAHEIAFAVGSIVVTVDDLARSWSVQDACAEEFDKDQRARDLRKQEVRDILDRAFRYARERKEQQAAS